MERPCKPLTLARILRARFVTQTDGNATTEFVIVFPLFIAMFLAAFELGLLQVRHTMLERGLDMAVRNVRLSTAAVPTYDSIRENICEGALVVPDCAQNLKLEMIRLNPWESFADMPAADCIDRQEEVNPIRSWVEGGPHDLMVMRACLLFEPLFPTTGIGYRLTEASANGGSYALTSTTAFVTEPE